MSGRKKALWVLSVCFLLIVFFGVFRKTILSHYAGLFELTNASKGADALVCLSGGGTTRVPETLRLWNQGYGSFLYLTEQKRMNHEFSKFVPTNLEFAELVTRQMELSAPWEIIPSLGEGATSTFDEAEDTLAFAKARKWKRIIIVTDEFHTSRAHYAFEKIFERSGIEVQVAGAPNEIFSRYDWWESDKGIASYFLETIKYPVYLFWDSEPSVVSND